MITFKNAFRRPLATIFGILIIVAEVAFISIGVGQAIYAKRTIKSIDYSSTTVALMTEKYQIKESGSHNQMVAQGTVPEEIKNWLSETAEKYPEIIKTVSSPGLASAYIPELTLDLYVEYEYPGFDFEISTVAARMPFPYGAPYTCVILEFVLSEMDEPTRWYSRAQQVDGTEVKIETDVSVNVKGKVTAAVDLQENYDDPTGYEVTFQWIARDIEEFEALDLTVGEKYILYGTDYRDNGWKHNSKSVNLVLKDEASRHKYIWTESSDGTLTPELVTERSYINENGETVICSVEEYRERYSVPTIAHVPDGVDAFLASEEGAEWRTAIEHIEINSHAFPVIGVQKLGYIADFARENARIVEGRDFTQEELDSGERVCIISETLAAKNGIGVGDTIDMNYYIYDWSVPYQSYIKDGRGVVEPAPYFYTSTTGLTDKESYTIVGLYRDETEWTYVEGDLYSFTPNTIFVPESSVTGSMDYSDQAFFRTYVLKNGSVDEFQQMVADAGYDGLFVCYDQGYSVISESLYAYDEVAMRALIVGVSASLVLAALYFILFPLQQKKNVMLMSTLGAPRKNRIAYILGSNLCILLPGTVLGLLLGIGAWQTVSSLLYSSVKAELYLSIDVNVPILLTISVIQFIFIFSVAAIFALLMTRDRKMYQRN